MHGYIALCAIALHALLVAFAGRLPDSIAPAVAATVYLPLWPLSTLGIPVFGRAESWGWSSPNLLGWLLLTVFWSCTWWLVASVFARASK